MIQSVRAAAALFLVLAAPTLDAATRLGFEDLLANLKSPNAKTRLEAAQELGKSRRKEAVAHLAPLVHDPEAKVRFEVVKALRELRDPSAVPALVTSLGDGDPGIRERDPRRDPCRPGALVRGRALPGPLLGRVRPRVHPVPRGRGPGGDPGVGQGAARRG
jgi:hypothetical protein